MIKKNALSHIISSIIIGGSLASPLAIAQSSPDESMDAAEITVIGSRVPGRTATDSAVPVDVISEEDIKKGGATQTVEMIQQLVPSFNSFKNSITDATDYVRPAQLRGLGPEHTLVLVNGKRRHTSAVVHDNEQARGSVAVDLNSIPPGAIGSVEVLRDGAAAQYGSDAVAGVININLKRSTAFEANVTYGQYLSEEDRGYGAGEALNGTNTDIGLFTGNNGNNLIDWTNNKSTKSHTDGGSYILNLSKGFDIGDSGYIGGSYQYWKQGRADRAGIDPTYQYFGKTPNGTSVVPTQINTNTHPDPTKNTTPAGSLVTPDPKEQTIDREMWWFGKSEMENHSLMLNGDYEFSEALKVYGFGNYSYREGRGPCFWREPRSNNNVRLLRPDGYLPNVTPENDDQSYTVGIEGQLGEYTYDLSRTYGKNDFHFFGDTLNASLGNASPTFFDGGGSIFTQETTNLDISRAFDIGLSEPLNVAMGAEYRRENYEIYLGQPESYTNGGVKVLDGPSAGATTVVGTQCVQCFFPVDASNNHRSNSAAYLDVEFNPMEKLTLGAAVRTEDYTDFGSTLNYKGSARMAINDVWALRSSYSTGFRAPALQQQYYSNRSLQTNSSGNLLQTGIFTVGSPTALGLGSKPLNPEESKSFGFGTTLEFDNLTITIDGYDVRVANRILLSDLFVAKPGAGPAYAAFLDNLAGTDPNLKGVTQTSFFINGMDTRTRGIDFIANWKPDFDMAGTLAFTLSANLNKTKVERLAETPSQLQPFTEQLILGKDKINNIQNAAPAKVANFVVDYKLDNINVRWKSVYYGEMKVAERFWSKDADFQTYGGTVIHDVEAGYSFMDESLKLTIGANNLLDTYPDKRYKSQSKLGELPYSGYQPFGFLGRYVYTRLDYKFE